MSLSWDCLSGIELWAVENALVTWEFYKGYRGQCKVSNIVVPLGQKCVEQKCRIEEDRRHAKHPVECGDVDQR